MLAHGGAGGAVAEAFFILVPLALFALLARKARRLREREEAVEAAEDEAADAEPDPDPTGA
jgi:hypothetical protein